MKKSRRSLRKNKNMTSISGKDGSGLMEALILGSLVVIIALLGFIAFMIFIIGYNIDKSQK